MMARIAGFIISIILIVITLLKGTVADLLPVAGILAIPNLLIWFADTLSSYTGPGGNSFNGISGIDTPTPGFLIKGLGFFILLLLLASVSYSVYIGEPL